jgi:hypothetical protein
MLPRTPAIWASLRPFSRKNPTMMEILLSIGVIPGDQIELIY